MSNNALLGGQGDEFNFDGRLVHIYEEAGDFWIPARDVAAALGYDNPRKAASQTILRNAEDFDGLLGVINLRTPGGTHEVQTLNEQGVYMFCMLARTDKAREFRRILTSHLQVVRRMRQSGQLEASLLQAIIPVMKQMIDEATTAAVSGALQAVDERQAALARTVARTEGRIGTLERTARVLSKRPMQLVLGTGSETQEFLPKALVSLRERRELRGWTQAQTAVFLAISRSHYSQIEEGLREPPAWLRKRIEELFQVR